MHEFAEQDRFAHDVGIELLESSAGYAKAQLVVTEKHFNGVNTVHGGVIFTLADFVFAVAANSHEGIAMAINVSMSYLKAVTEGVVFAEAEEVSLTPKLGSYIVRVTHEEGEVIAIFQGMTYRKKT